MSHYRFAWDPDKAHSNAQKHGVSFDEAKAVFEDLWAIQSFDVDHSLNEDRFMIIGRSERERLLVVSFTVPDYQTIRIISARRAQIQERKSYEEKSRSR